MFHTVQKQCLPQLARVAIAALVLPVALGLATHAYAQEARAPNAGPIEITVGTGAGGTPDVVMRLTANVLNETGLVTEPLVVQNRTGGSWTVAANWVLDKPGNENDLLALAGPIWSTPIVQGVPTIYDKVTPIAMFVSGEVAIGVRPDSGITNLKELLAKAAERPRGMKVAGAQVGAVDHLVTGMLQEIGDVEFNYIPFDGGGAAQTAFLGGNSDMIVLSIDQAVVLQRAGTAKIIAVLSETRRDDADFKDVPTAVEQGYDIVWSQTWGLAGPPNLDPAVVKWWDEKITAMKQTPEWQKTVADNWLRSVDIPNAAVGEWVAGYHNRYQAALRTVGLAKE